ncbi:DUF4314 domain-containing protein [Actinoplanes sp. NPDC049599]|uniref:DUF4314 domain-containing protein n=1 Tax=Actinoplanes sp. NPDC049599 TaxID=3363903 RepID=UPI0037AA92B4
MTDYQPGRRVALVHTDDPYTDLRPGDTGTVVRHDQDQHTVGIAWDRGSRLAMCLDGGDRIRLLAPVPDDPTPGWTAVLRQLRVRGAEAGRDVADDWAQQTLAGLPADGAQAVRAHMLAGIDVGDAGVLALLPTFTPPPRWAGRDTAEVRYHDAVADSAHHLPANAAPAPGWSELNNDQRAQTVTASRDSFNAAVRQRISELCRPQNPPGSARPE